MSKQMNNISIVDEIIENASELPLECQEWLLAIAKGMVFAKNCLEKQSIEKKEEQKGAS